MSLFIGCSRVFKVKPFFSAEIISHEISRSLRGTPFLLLPVTANFFLCQGRCDVNTFISRTGVCRTMGKRERERNGVDTANPDLPPTFDWMEIRKQFLSHVCKSYQVIILSLLMRFGARHELQDSLQAKYALFH